MPAILRHTLQCSERPLKTYFQLNAYLRFRHYLTYACIWGDVSCLNFSDISGEWVSERMSETVNEWANELGWAGGRDSSRRTNNKVRGVGAWRVARSGSAHEIWSNVILALLKDAWWEYVMIRWQEMELLWTAWPGLHSLNRCTFYGQTLLFGVHHWWK